MIDLTQRNPVVGNPDYAVRIPALISDLQVAASAPVPPYGHKPSTTAGLTWGYYGGQRWVNGALTTVTDSTLALTAASTNYVEYTDAGVVSKNTAGFSADKNPIAEITTDGSSITAILDRRSQRDPSTGRLSKSVAGGADVTLTAAEARNEIIEFTGLLTANIAVIVPTRARPWAMSNATTGAFTLTVKTAAGTGKEITQGKRAVLFCDATNVESAFDDLGAAGAPFSDATGLVKAAADATKLLKLLAGGIATGTTRTAYAADEDSVVANDWHPRNMTIAHTRSGNAETLALKDRAGNDFSSTNPLILKFRNATAGTGDYVNIAVTAALSITISSGSTLGASSGVPFRLWLVAFNDAGTPRLGLVNCLSGTSIMGLKDDDIRSSTAEGGAGAADSARVLYTGTSVSSKALRILGYLEYTLATAGTWNTAPSKVHLFGPGVPLPGAVVQSLREVVTAGSSNTTQIPVDNTIPQNTEGAQIGSGVAITPTSSANVLKIVASIFGSDNTAGAMVTSAIFQDSTANALRARTTESTGGNQFWNNVTTHFMVAATTSSTTFKQRVGPGGGQTVYVNRNNAAADVFNGTADTHLEVTEFMT